MSQNVYGARCSYWVPGLAPAPKLSKKEKDAITRNKTIEEQNAIPDNTLCLFYIQLTIKCDYRLRDNTTCEYMGKR